MADRGTSDSWWVRDMGAADLRHLFRLIGLLGIVVGAAATTLAATDYFVPVHPFPVGIIGVWWILAGLLVIAIASALSDRTLKRIQAPLIYPLFVLSVTSVTAVMYGLGPQDFGYIVLATHVVPSILAMYLMPPKVGYTYMILALAGLALVMTVQPGWKAPGIVLVVAAAYFLVTTQLVAGIVERHDHARGEVAEMNATLQERVDEQVEELQQLGQLRRFLSAQVADVLSSKDADDLLKPHRREIAVFFADLRSYTRFTVAEAPEDVLASLDEYYATVCAILQRHNATIGSFSGDGIMAFLNDPLPHDDPAGAAVRIALELHDEMEPLLQRWEARGFSLGYGVGIAMGYATLGLLGNEERSDYTAVGPVVNLASRLCTEAKNGQILIDHRGYSAVKGWANTEPLEPVSLKGFPEPVPTYSVIEAAN